MSMELFEKKFGSQAKEDPAEVAADEEEADEAAALARKNILVAARAGDLAAVRGFVRQDPGSVEEEDHGITALHYAAVGHAALVEFLLSKNAPVDAMTSYESNTPLMNAAKNCRVDCVKLLLAAGARTDLKNICGKTAMDLAEENGQLEIVRLLLDFKFEQIPFVMRERPQGNDQKPPAAPKDRQRLMTSNFWPNVPLKGMPRQEKTDFSISLWAEN
eukprot:s995_g38.t2